MLGNGIVIREKEILTVDQSVLRDKVENNERREEIGDKRKMNPWQFHFGQKLCSWYLGHLHNNETQVRGGNSEKMEKKKTKKYRLQDTIQLHNNGTQVRGGNTEKMEKKKQKEV